MSEIKCPKCGTTFKVDDASYADILSQVRGAEFENELHSRLKESEKQAKADKELALAKSETEIEQLKAKLKAAETEKELAVTKALAPVEKERDQLASDLKAKANEAQLRETSIVAQYKGALKLKDDEIQQLKDMKAKLSTKMIGETLEQHCQNSFN